MKIGLGNKKFYKENINSIKFKIDLLEKTHVKA